MRYKFVVVGSGLGGCLAGLDAVLAITIIIIGFLNRVRRNRGLGGFWAVVLGDEVAEADYTSLGH